MVLVIVIVFLGLRLLNIDGAMKPRRRERCLEFELRQKGWHFKRLGKRIQYSRTRFEPDVEEMKQTFVRRMIFVMQMKRTFVSMTSQAA